MISTVILIIVVIVVVIVVVVIIKKKIENKNKLFVFDNSVCRVNWEKNIGELLAVENYNTNLIVGFIKEDEFEKLKEVNFEEFYYKKRKWWSGWLI